MNWRKAWSNFTGGFHAITRKSTAEKEFISKLNKVNAARLEHAKAVVINIIRMEQNPLCVEDAIDLRNYAEKALAEGDDKAFDGAVRAINTRMMQTIERNVKRFDELNNAFAKKTSELIENSLDTERTANQIAAIARNLRAQLESSVEVGLDPCVIMQLGCEALDSL